MQLQDRKEKASGFWLLFCIKGLPCTCIFNRNTDDADCADKTDSIRQNPCHPHHLCFHSWLVGTLQALSLQLEPYLKNRNEKRSIFSIQPKHLSPSSGYGAYR